MAKKPRKRRTASDPLSRFFLLAFIFSCALFWWGPSFVYQVVLNIDDPVRLGTIAISIFALLLFIAGFCIPKRSDIDFLRLRPDEILDVGRLAGTITRVFGIFAFAVALH
ncbi:MAG: hypothetical protein ACO1NO_03655, partial [Burkholderiaceae bacterium]